MADNRFHARRRDHNGTRRGVSTQTYGLWQVFSRIVVMILIMTVFVNFVVNPMASFAVRQATRLLHLKRTSSASINGIPSAFKLNHMPKAAVLNTNQPIVDRDNNSYFSPLQPVRIKIDDHSHPRQSDVHDMFANYSFREHQKCSISSLDLHLPFEPLCSDRASFLNAFSSGGRVGFDTPYVPRGCDMRWFSTSEACEIFSRFDKVIFIGDSMMRHVVGALNVILREDLGYGAVTGWNFGEEEKRQCFCTHQMDVKACSIQGIYRTEDVLKHDPASFKCHKTAQKVDGKTIHSSPVNLVIELMLKYPLDPIEIGRFQDLLPSTRPEKPIAFIFGHGLWNDLDIQATVHWLNGLYDAIYTKAEYLRIEHLPQEHDFDHNNKPFVHALFISPSAPGVLKPDQWVQTQGDKAIQVFESSMHHLIHESNGMFSSRGLEHMGTWNMSVQMHKWDGVHLDVKGNLIKAMGVINWLAGINVEIW